MIQRNSTRCLVVAGCVWMLTCRTTNTVVAQESVRFPTSAWDSAAPAEVGLDASKLTQARDYALTAGGSGMIVRHGLVAFRWGDQARRYDIKSATKSFGATALGVAIKDGKLALDAPARRYHPSLGIPPQSNAETGWLESITIQHLATHTSGFDKPGGYEKLLFAPGTRWHYSDGGPNWLAECITLVYERDLEDWMFERVFTPLGIGHEDLQWRKNQYRESHIAGVPRREFGAGIHANVEALSRLGYLYLQKGRWREQPILSPDFVRQASRPLKSLAGLREWEPNNHGNASEHYGLLWWNNADGALQDVPRDVYWAWGLYDSLIVVMPSLDMVVVRGGENGRQLPRAEGAGHYDVLVPLLEPIVQAVTTNTEASAEGVSVDSAPYPQSSVITGIEWADPSSIVRLAEGSDNWPLTWARDDFLYTAYGDGWGFLPKVETKLSMGFARIGGSAAAPQGVNIRSVDGERSGQGSQGEKASGMLAVDGTLYLWIRNAENARLGWSADHARHWQWTDWKFTTSFGCPTFLNFGKDYAGARDDFVYVYSHDAASAYEAAERMVLARVPKTRLRDRQAYEFFVRRTGTGEAVWSAEIEDRGAVFEHPGNCYRSGISYDAGLRRYLWCQTLPQSEDPRGPRFQGGFGIYDAAEPWGPWTTVFFTRNWDVGPGETNSFPTKWMSADGTIVHLVFSGEDSFSVRKAVLQTAASSTGNSSNF